MRINKLFSNLGICSRRETNRLIEEGRVKVNGVLSIPGQWVESEDEILIDDKPIMAKKKIYIAFNKPVGITCTSASEVKDNIIDFINYEEYIFPVGRLDKKSHGLILMTNDGDLANKILNSDNYHEKEYVVTVDKPIDNNFINHMSTGVYILGEKTRPCKVIKIDEYIFKIILTQGLNRQIRRMSKALGYNVIELERIRICSINVEGIYLGKWRHLSEEEVRQLILYGN
ncbi:pseudouridine synthase [Clostridium sp. UBA1056]|uniref:pseudouridine synthase n=1 Tax=unclassified Clostridium TaxID=2614128 RepID=UPI003217AD79